jgi:hypothetical protein
MATFNLKRFSRPGGLKAIRADHLVSLLAPYSAFFVARGVTLPPAGDEDRLDYEGLVRVLMTPDSDTPSDLANALFFVHEMSTPGGMDELLPAAEAEGIAITGNPDPTPADVAVQVWLRDPRLLERKHAERYLERPRSFEYYRTTVSPVPEFRQPSRETIARLEQDLDDWFSKKRRGRGARVFVYPKADGVWFLVRHGQPYERKAVVRDGESESLFFRGEAHDVLVYDPTFGEIRMNASSKGERETYRTKFGRHFFGDDEFFPGTAKYTLEPLRTDGARSLVCNDVEGMEWVKLKQVEFFRGGPAMETEVRKATDVFAAFDARGRSLPDRARIARASFSVKFRDSKTPRTVTVRPPHVTQYTRDDDSTVAEMWLRKRGFTVGAR